MNPWMQNATSALADEVTQALELWWPIAADALLVKRIRLLDVAARNLFDNRMDSVDRHSYYVKAPRELWADLGEALYGADDPRAQELGPKVRDATR